MQRFSELIGRPVVSQDVGAKIGNVADLLIDAGDVTAIVLAGGILSSEHVLPFSEIRLLGEDAVIVSSGDAMLNAKQWSQRGASAHRLSNTIKKPIVTTGGETLGTVGDVYVDGQGRISAYDVETRGFAGLVKRHARLPVEGVTAGPHALVVSEAAASEFKNRE